MTTTELTTKCPECKAAGPVDLGDGLMLCLECRAEWNPLDPELLARASVDAILGPEMDGGLFHATEDPGLFPATTELAPGGPLTASEDEPGTEAPPDDWTGFFVRDTLTPNRRVLLVIQDDGDPLLLVQDRTGTDFHADRATLEFLGSDPDLAQEIEVDGSSDETAPVSSLILAVAGLALEAGVEIVGEGDEPELYTPRIGWMPPPCDGVPEAEQGVAYAVGILVRHFDLDKALVRQLAAGLLTGAEVAPESETER